MNIELKKKYSDYLKSGGLTCPHCDSLSITGDGSIETDAGVAWQHVSCDDCAASWTDQYSLSSVDTDDFGIIHVDDSVTLKKRLSKDLSDAEVDSESLDSLVYDGLSLLASAVNNEGLEAQVDAILFAYGAEQAASIVSGICSPKADF